MSFSFFSSPRSILRASFCTVLFLFLSISFLLFSLFVPSYLTDWLNSSILNQIIVDSPSSPHYSTWLDNRNSPPGAGTYVAVYLWSITNYDEYLQGLNTQPYFVERGPYVYREFKVHFNVSFSPDRCSVTYRTWTYYVFDQTLSQGNENDEIVTLNSLLWFLGQVCVVTDDSPSCSLFEYTFSSAYNSTVIPGEILFMKKTAKELIFGYYYDTKDNLLFIGGSLTNYSSLADAMRLTLYDTTATGKCEETQIRQYIIYQNKSALNYWNSSSANAIGGTDGGQFPRLINGQKQQFSLWMTFRTFNLVSSGIENFLDIQLNRYKFDPNIYEPAWIVPQNNAFYSFFARGVLNLTALNPPAPSYMTNPHLLGVDPAVASKVGGMNLNQFPDGIFDSELAVEPLTGLCFKASVKLQSNAYLEPLRASHLSTVWFPNLSPALFPIFWSNTYGSIDREDASLFVHNVYFLTGLVQVCFYGGWTLFALCLSLSILCSFMWIARVRSFRSFLTHQERLRLQEERSAEEILQQQVESVMTMNAQEYFNLNLSDEQAKKHVRLL
jgi:hypothetical protein